MTVQQINQKLESLRREYLQSPSRRTIIEVRAKALKNALKIAESRLPPQQAITGVS